jgi:NAD(P)-dependent dehydrogenase (short-subunit alcohol dehydrogenase family)
VRMLSLSCSRSYCTGNREKLKKDGLDVKLVQLDVTDPNSIRAAKDFIEKVEGKLDVLVNNAGILHFYSLANHVTHKPHLQ